MPAAQRLPGGSKDKSCVSSARPALDPDAETCPCRVSERCLAQPPPTNGSMVFDDLHAIVHGESEADDLDP